MIYNLIIIIKNQLAQLFTQVQSNIKTIHTEYKSIQKNSEQELSFHHQNTNNQNTNNQIHNTSYNSNTSTENNTSHNSNTSTENNTSHNSNTSAENNIKSIDINVLSELPKQEISISIEDKAKKLQEACKQFNFNISIRDVIIGPTVIIYEIMLESGTKMRSFTNHTDDIGRIISARSIHIIRKSGSDSLEIQVARDDVEHYSIKELLEYKMFTESPYDLPIILGKKTNGKPKIIDLAKTPHLLVAGTTGSGKSVQINTIIISLLLKFQYY
ncbi:MAG: DNA translocase FtsK, partial [Pseudomonadota bacterium]